MADLYYYETMHGHSQREFESDAAAVQHVRDKHSDSILIMYKENDLTDDGTPFITVYEDLENQKKYNTSAQDRLGDAYDGA